MRLSTKAWHLILVSLIIFALWFALHTLELGFFLSDDNGNYFLGTYTYTYQSIVHDHTIPVINYHQLLGNPHLGQGQSSVFYPLLYPAFFLSYLFTNSSLLGIPLLILFHFIFAALGLYLLLLDLKVNPSLSFLAALLYISFPFVIGVSRIWIVVPYLLAYLPWNWWALGRFLKKPTKSKSLMLILIKLLLVLQGYIQWVLLAALLEFIYLGVILWQQHRLQFLRWIRTKWFLPYLPIWPLVALLGAPVLLPLWHTAQRSDVRAAAVTTSDFMRITVSLTDWLKAQLFQFKSGVIFDGSTFIYHLGLILLITFIYLIYRSRHSLRSHRIWFTWLLMTAITFLICTDLYIIAYYLPVLNWFRWPFKHLLPFEFFFTVALSIGLSRFARTKGQLQVATLILSLGIATNIYVVSQNRGVTTAFSTDRVNSSPPSWINLIHPDSGRTVTFGVDLEKSHDQRSLGAFDYASLDNYTSLGGYDATVSTTVWQAIGALPEFGATNPTVNRDLIDYVRTWGVAYWITDNPVAASNFITDHPDLPQIYTQDNTAVFEDSQSLPLAYWSDNTPADFTFHPNGITVDPHGHSGPLLFNVISWPEYLATADDQPLSITVISNRPTITVPPGVKQIKLTYIDHQLRLGLIISAFTLLGLATFLNYSSILKNLRTINPLR